MNRLQPGFMIPSAVYTIEKKSMAGYLAMDKPPEIGDLVYGKVETIGQHDQLENKWARIHKINSGSRSVFVFGNRYAPDYYEGIIPKEMENKVDLLARSGLVGNVTYKNDNVKDPTQVRILGYVVDKNEQVLNTHNFSRINPKVQRKKEPRAKLILVVGTAMNSGKSQTAAACCWALSTAGYTVRASKITGTASLKDILYMEDCGASAVTDFTYFGYPSTYMLNEAELLDIFDKTDLKIGNNSKNFWVVEIADGILQRETAMLLQSPSVKKRIHKLIFAAHDGMGAIGGVRILKDKFGLTPDGISGVCSSSPLALRELSEYSDKPIFNNLKWNLQDIISIII